MQEIEMIAYNNVEGKMRPLRFRLISEDESLIVVKIDRILFNQDNVREGTIKYRCEVVIQGLKKQADIYFNKSQMKWYLQL